MPWARRWNGGFQVQEMISVWFDWYRLLLLLCLPGILIPWAVALYRQLAVIWTVYKQKKQIEIVKAEGLANGQWLYHANRGNSKAPRLPFSRMVMPSFVSHCDWDGQCFVCKAFIALQKKGCLYPVAMLGRVLFTHCPCQLDGDREEREKNSTKNKSKWKNPVTADDFFRQYNWRKLVGWGDV